jgi:hypothetical protein
MTEMSNALRFQSENLEGKSTGEIKRRLQSDIEVCLVDIFLRCEPNLSGINKTKTDGQPVR